VLLSFALMTLLGAPEGAPETAFVIDWRAPPECPATADIRERVAQMLGDQAEDTLQRAPGSMTGRVEQEGGQWTLTLHIENPAGVSDDRVTGGDCRMLAEVAAVKVAVAVSPEAVVETLEEARRPQPVARAETPVAPQPEPPAAAKTPSPAPSGFLRLAGAVGDGVLPRIDAGVGVAGGVLIRQLRVELGATYWFPMTVTAPGADDDGGRIFMVSGYADACPVPGLGPLEFPVCLGIELGDVEGRGIGIDDPKRARRLWVGARVGPALVWRMTRRLALWVQAQGVVALLRPGFSLEEHGIIHRSAGVALRGVLGMEVRLP